MDSTSSVEAGNLLENAVLFLLAISFVIVGMLVMWHVFRVQPLSATLSNCLDAVPDFVTIDAPSKSDCLSSYEKDVCRKYGQVSTNLDSLPVVCLKYFK